MRKHALTMLGCLLALAPGVRADNFYIEIDYMVGGTPNHSHQPSQAVIDAVVQMFACQGHTLTIVVDDQLTHVNVLVRDPNDCDASLFSYNGTNSYGAIKAANFDRAANANPWHYCIFAHQYEDGNCNTTTSSGLANSGEDFIVTLGAFSGQTGTLFDQAATLAHEFGHNLGLSHCGSQYCGSDTADPDYVGPYVSNMPSVMSYRYQLSGVKFNMLCNGLTFDLALFKDIDYSHGRMCALDEDALNEVAGTQMISTDWDCDGTLEASIAWNTNNNNFCDSGGNRTIVTDYNEWANLVDGAAIPANMRSNEEYTCITAEEWNIIQNQMAMRGGSCGQPTLATENCLSGENMYVGDFFFVEAGTCIFPYDSVQQAHNAAPNNSRFYIKPGTYNEAGVVTLDKPGYYFCNTGSAIID